MADNLGEMVRPEIATNFAPSVDKSLPRRGESKHLKPEEVGEKTKQLYDLLVHRVELRADIHRQSDEEHKPQSTQKASLNLQEKLDLIKKGGVKAAVSQVVETDAQTRTLATDLSELAKTESSISELTKEPQVLAEYDKFREKRVEKLRQAKEVADGRDAIRQLRLQQEKMARSVFLAGRQFSPGERQIIDENNQLIKAINTRVSELKKDLEVFDLARLRQLEEYQKGIKTDRFAETPSRERYIDSVRALWSQGKKVLLTGSTGGGKTELLLHASRSLFGVEAERLTGHELMTNYEVYGKTKGGVSPEGTMTLMFGAAPFIRAIEDDKPFVFDEINAVPNRVLMRMKTDLNARFGQQVTIQEDSDKRIKIGERFAVGATMNVKSEKYIDREKLDPALVRMFESVAIDYFPPEELYDIMLSSMMDIRGGVKLSSTDAHNTLKALCDATNWIQKAYLGEVIQTGPGRMLEARGQGSTGRTATLQEAVLDPGKAIDILTGWEDAEKSGLTFQEFLNQKIISFINNENFPEEDRYYLTEIFALQKFLKGVKVSDLRLSGLDQGTLDAWSGYDGMRHIPKANYIPPEVVAKLDPYGTMKRPVAVEAGDLLDEEVVTEVPQEDLNVEQAAATAVNTRATQSASAPVRNVNNAPGYAAAFAPNISADTRDQLNNLDKRFDPNSLSGLSHTAAYITYPQELTVIAQFDPGSLSEVSKRFENLLGMGPNPGGEDLDKFSKSLESLADIASRNNDDKALKNIQRIVARAGIKINDLDETDKIIWRSSINSSIRRIQNMVVRAI